MEALLIALAPSIAEFITAILTAVTQQDTSSAVIKLQDDIARARVKLILATPADPSNP